MEGVAPSDDVALSDEQVRDLVADAASAIVLYTGSLFGKTLLVTSTDPDSGAPDGYAISEELTLAEQTAVAAQAALDHFFHHFIDRKTSERLKNEAVEWEWTTSAQLMRDQFAQLVAARDKALESIDVAGLERFSSYLAVRDVAVARAVEPYALEAGAGGGLELDYRFA